MLLYGLTFAPIPLVKASHVAQLNIGDAGKVHSAHKTVLQSKVAKGVAKESEESGVLINPALSETKLSKRDTEVEWWHYCPHQAVSSVSTQKFSELLTCGLSESFFFFF